MMKVLCWCCYYLCVGVVVGLKSHNDKRLKMGSRRSVKVEVGWVRLVWWGEVGLVCGRWVVSCELVATRR